MELAIPTKRPTRRPRPKLQFSGLLLYFLTVVLEAPVIFVRLMAVFFLVVVPSLIIGHPLSVNLWFLIGLAPTLWSMFALINPVGGGWWWRQNAGGRDPSQREQNAYEDAIEYLQARRPEHLGPLALPGSWFVLDEDVPDAGVVGSSLMLSRELLQIHLPAVLPHELGHLASFDGRFTLALNRLVIRQAPRPRRHPDDPERPGGDGLIVAAAVLDLARVRPSTIEVLTGIYIFMWCARRILRFARGGFALKLTAPLWGHYWRGREYAADAYAAQLGQADELADFLETNALIYDLPIPCIWLTDTDHDFTELRIDRLRNYGYEQPLLEPAQTPTV
jgi:Zn-dependent protease with chaperone function